MRRFFYKKGGLGQTLFEVVVAVSVAVLVITGILTAIVLSSANAEFARRQAEATRYGQEAIEWLRAERDRGWGDFSGRADTQAWCLKTLSWDIPVGCRLGNLEDDIDETSYWREARFGPIDRNPPPYNVSVTVSWQDAKGRTHSSRLETKLVNK